MGLVDLDFGVLHGGVAHHQVEQFLGQALKQGEAVLFDVLNHRLGDGPVIQGVIDVVIPYRFLRGIQDGEVDQDILLVEDLVFINPDKSAQTQVFDTDAGRSWLKLWHYDLLRPINCRNSMRVLLDSRNAPSMTEVFMVEFCFSTPRIIMHMCLASITTATPAAWVML